MRIFSFASRQFTDRFCGGGRGVNFRLCAANEKYNCFDDIYFIFNDGFYHNNTLEHFLLSENGVELSVDSFWGECANTMEMSSEDIYIFHDVEGFVRIKEMLPFIEKTMIVYHQQGGMYYEFVAMGNDEDPEVEKFFNEIMQYAFSNVTVPVFPSRGAYQALLDTAPVSDSFRGKEIEVLYNGCSISISNDSKDDYVNNLINILKSFNGYKYITTATLNDAKGVDRLPAFFKKLKEKGHSFLWIIVGNGKLSPVIEKELKDLEGYAVWIPDHIDNQDLMRINSQMDFYILFHRFSIFDFATVEAMHSGVIPILNKVGGNLEMITDDNGLLLEDISDVDSLLEYINHHSLNELKEKNKRIAGEKFSEKAFIEGYKKLIDSKFTN